MHGQLTISLDALRFFAFHGLHAGERKTGNEFEVNLAVTFETDESMISGISNTVNYVSLAEIVSRKMEQPVDLLEALAMSIAEEIHTAYPRIRTISISITKLHPPISAFRGHTTVRYQKEYQVR